METTKVFGCGQCEFSSLSEHELRDHLISAGHKRPSSFQLLGEDAHGFVHRLVRLVFGLLLLFPVSLIIAFDAFALAISESAGAIAAAVSFLVAWLVGGFFASSPRSFARIYGRACVAYAVAAFVLPVAGIVFVVTGGFGEGEVGLRFFFAFLAVVFGLFTGINAAVLGQLTLGQNDDPATATI